MTKDPHEPDEDRRSLGLLLAALSGAAGLAAIASCREASATSFPEVTSRVGAALTPGPVRWVGTVLGAPPPLERTGDLATTTEATLGASVVIAQGCVKPGDGGGGVFVWSATLAPDDGGTVIVPVPPDGGAPGGCWRRIYDKQMNVLWFGATPGTGGADGGVTGTDCTKAIQNAMAAATDPANPSAQPSIFFPQGTYLTTGLTLSASGLDLVGASPKGGSGQKGAVLVLHGPSPQALLTIQCSNVRLRSLWLDGNGVAPSVVGILSGSSLTFEDCIVTGAIPGSGGGLLVNFSGPGAIQGVRFLRCQIRQDFSGTAKASYAIWNTAPDAFNIDFEHCLVSDAHHLVNLVQGSCNFRRCRMLRAVEDVVLVGAVCHQFTLEQVHTEPDPGGANGGFLNQSTQSGVLQPAVGPYPITIRDCVVDSGAGLSINCTQPVVLLGNAFTGSVVVTPAGPYRVVSVGNVFVGTAVGAGFSDPAGRVEEYADTNLGTGIAGQPLFTTHLHSALGTLAPAVFQPTPFDYGSASALAVAQATTVSPLPPNTIPADDHWILILQNDLPGLTLSPIGAQLGSRIRVSRLSSGDGHTATVNGVVLGTAAGLVGWAEWIFDEQTNWRLYAQETN
jgi:hypothetical protein